MLHLRDGVKKGQKKGNCNVYVGRSVGLDGGIYCNGVLVSIAIVKSNQKCLLVMS